MKNGEAETMKNHTSSGCPIGVVVDAEQQPQASILAVFGHATPLAAASHYQTIWDRAYPEKPLDPGALIHGLMADMNASLPEPFEVNAPDCRYITGPDLPSLPIGWAAAAKRTFQEMDLQLDTYTVASVQAWRAAGNGGYPWTWQPSTPAGSTDPQPRVDELTGARP